MTKTSKRGNRKSEYLTTKEIESVIKDFHTKKSICLDDFIGESHIMSFKKL